MLLHHQPASFEHSSRVKLGWYSSHHLWRSLVSSFGPSSMKTIKGTTTTIKHAMKIIKSVKYLKPSLDFCFFVGIKKSNL